MFEWSERIKFLLPTLKKSRDGKVAMNWGSKCEDYQHRMSNTVHFWTVWAQWAPTSNTQKVQRQKGGHELGIKEWGLSAQNVKHCTFSNGLSTMGFCFWYLKSPEMERQPWIGDWRVRIASTECQTLYVFKWSEHIEFLLPILEKCIGANVEVCEWGSWLSPAWGSGRIQAED